VLISFGAQEYTLQRCAALVTDRAMPKLSGL
jgi:hypothetical protein